MTGAIRDVNLTGCFSPQAMAVRSVRAAATPRPRRYMRVACAICGRSVLRSRARYGASAVFVQLLIPTPGDVFVAEPGTTFGTQSSKLERQVQSSTERFAAVKRVVHGHARDGAFCTSSLTS